MLYDLLDLFSLTGTRFLPSDNGTKVAIETVAQEAVLQEPKYRPDRVPCMVRDVTLNI